MIAPSVRLLRWIGWVGLPLALIDASAPVARDVLYGIAIMAIGFIALDAVRAGHRACNMRISIPSPVRLMAGQPGEVPVIWAVPNAPPPIRLGVDWPPDVGIASCIQTLADPAREGIYRWPCQPVRRGRHALRNAALAVRSPWGLWEIRRRIPIDAELHVLPNLRDERRRVAARFLLRGGAGLCRRRPVGKGREFEQLREYVPGDDYGDIHWKATARRQHPVTKLFQIERTQEVFVAIDASRLAGRAATPRAGESISLTLLDRFITAALLLISTAQDQGDRFGLILFDRIVRRFLPAARGSAHLHRCREALIDASPASVSPDYREMLALARTQMRKRTLIVVLAALDDAAAAAGFAAAAAAAARQHLLLAMTVRAPGARPVFSGPPPATLKEAYRVLDGHERWRRLEELRRTLRRAGIIFEAIEDELLSGTVITRYLEAREWQRL